MSILKSIEIAWKHRGQPDISDTEGKRRASSINEVYFEKSYDFIEVVRRGCDLIINSAVEVDVSITAALPAKPIHDGGRQRQKTLLSILNFSPNIDEDTNQFRSQLYMDLLITGNAYQYWDSKTNNLHHLPAKLMEIETGEKRKVKRYIFNGKKTFYPYEIIHTKDNASHTVYEGRSRLYSAKDSINVLRKMLAFQENFFENGAIPGLVIQTPNVLGDKIKRKLLTAWRTRFNPSSGGREPMILDGDLKVNPLSNTKFNELDFEDSIAGHETKILKALGVPPVLLNSGNNANLRPNIQLFYETTVLPLVSKVISSYERFFGYDMEAEVVKVRSLRPELQEAANYYQGLVNTGIMTINEARAELRLPPSSEAHADELRIPQNIAGSAEDPSVGGRPEGSTEDDEEGESED